MTMNQAMNNSPMMINDTTNNQASSSSPRPLAPNPFLSSSLPSHHNNRSSLSKRRHAHRREHSHHNESRHHQHNQPLLSASIPLPKTHIHRTPSELQLADDMRRAEYEDVRMYARLVVGMQSQCMVSGYVHPLTKKSLQDILKTKAANDEELNHQDDDEEDGDYVIQEEGWELDYTNTNEDCPQRDENASVDTPLPCQPLGTSGERPTIIKTPSDRSMVSILSNEADEDCMFSLEL